MLAGSVLGGFSGFEGGKKLMSTGEMTPTLGGFSEGFLSALPVAAAVIYAAKGPQKILSKRNALTGVLALYLQDKIKSNFRKEYGGYGPYGEFPFQS